MNYVLGLGFINLFIAFLVTKSLVPYLIKFGTQYNLLDKHEERKQNKKGMVRIGGISILIGFLISQFFRCLKHDPKLFHFNPFKHF